MVSGRAASSCATGSAGTPGQGHASSTRRSPTAALVEDDDVAGAEPGEGRIGRRELRGAGVGGPGSGPDGGQHQVGVAGGDRGGRQPAARPIPRRRVVDHPEQGERDRRRSAKPPSTARRGRGASRQRLERRRLRADVAPARARSRSRGAPGRRRACGRGGRRRARTQARTSARSVLARAGPPAATIARARSSSGSISSSQIAISSSLLALDVVVEAAGGEAGRLGQLAHRGRLVAALGEELGGGRDDLAAAARRSARAAPGGSAGLACGISGATVPNGSSKFECIIRYNRRHGLRPLRRPRTDPAAPSATSPSGEVAPVAEELDRTKSLPLRDRRASSASWA